MKATCPACGAASVITSLLLPCEQCKRVFEPAVEGAAWLEFDDSRVVLLRGDAVTIGRGEQSDVRINSGRVSRVHARLSRARDGHWSAKDLGSSGGTYIDSVRIPSNNHRGERLLRSGDLLVPLDVRYFNAFVPRVTHFESLDAQVTERSAWEVQTDALLEQGDPLGHWMRSPPDDLRERMAFIGAFVTPWDKRGQLKWNDFGFVETLTVDESLLFERPWFGDPARAPGLQYLTRLELQVTSENFARCCDVLSAIPLPRSLRHIAGIRLPPALRTLRERCPWLETE